MCGICGIIQLNQTSVSPDCIMAMRDSMAHRGPDDAGLWFNSTQTVSLGHRRLSIIDLSAAGHQPMSSHDGQLWIVFNGEIYNYLELRQELQIKGHTFRSQSDTEVLLAAYREWGTECLDYLNGMFAFAIWDETRQELFAARDRFGEKPFFYVYDKKRFAFASEIKGLLVLPEVTARANLNSIYRYLAYRETSVGDQTFFEGVYALPQGCALSLNRAGDLKIWRYWELQPQKGDMAGSREEASQKFYTLFTDAIRLRLRSDVPIGSSLSGGLDSSAVVSTIASLKENGQVQKTFSARFDDVRFDEGKHIETVTKWCDVTPYEVHPNPDSLPDEAASLMWHQEEPFLSTSIYAQWNVMRLAKQEGVIVLLDGQGADEILAGYHIYFGSLLRGYLKYFHWHQFLAEAAAYLKLHGTRQLSSVGYLLLSESVTQQWKRHIRPLGIASDLEKNYASAYKQPARRFAEPLNQDLYVTLTQTILPPLLRYADRNSMAFSREMRLPFLDHRLVEFLFALPPNYKIKQGTTKIILREAMQGHLPDEIRTRRDKLGYAPPETIWLRRGKMKTWLQDLLHAPSLSQRGWLDASTVRRVTTEHWQGQRDWHSLLWRWACLELWAQTFLD